MTDRTPACEDAGIAERMAEIQRERMAAITGCACGTLGPAQHDTSGNLVHAPQCPLRAPPVQLALAVAMERLRARHQRRPMTEDEIYAEGVAQKYARWRVLT